MNRIYSLSGLGRPLVAALLLGSAFASSAANSVNFNRDIRPILSDNCFSCHGPDQNRRKAKLRLDVREEAIALKAFIPGKPKDSELVKRILTDDEDDLMPPPESHKKLTPAQKELLQRWVAEGAEYQSHWAYAAPKRPVGKGGIDVLVQERLKEIGLKPSPQADRRTLARRLWFDLLGLPPKPDEVDAFVKDKSPDAYGKLVDRLLASPHYGERMAIGWLDVVRFADTIGYHSDNPRNIHPYRDYVIKAFNENKRFDQFTREQLAGDLLADASQETRVGSAFNRLILSTEEGGAQSKDYEQRYLTDRVRAVGTVWLAQTIGCAQCHDHKFDPTTQRDFYSMGAFFADIKEPIVGKRESGLLVPSDKDTAELARLDAKLAKAQKDYDGPHKELTSAFTKWQDASLVASENNEKWKQVKPTKVASTNGVKLTVQKDNSILASDKNPTNDTYTVTLTGALDEVVGLRLEVLPDDSLPMKGPGRATNGNFVLSEVTATVTRGQEKPEPVKFTGARATFEQTVANEKSPARKWTAASTIAGDAKGKPSGWAVLPEAGKAQQLVLALGAPLTIGKGDTLTIELKQNHTEKEHLLGRFRLATTTNAECARVAHPPAPPAEIVTILKVAAEKRSGPQKDKLFDHYKGLVLELAALRTEIADTKKAKKDLDAKIPKCLVTVAAETRRTVRLLPRGNWMDESGPVVQPALPSFLPVSLKKEAKTNAPLSRLDLAEWMIAKENPLTARVFVNRVWRQFFGTGLSKVIDDMGAQGEPPVNPALLDWLACEFIDSGWDVKHVVRTMVMSGTYQQVSTASKELQARDPFNRELARQSRWRLDAELVRDNALSVAGLLVPKIGGPSVKPYQPDGYWENLNFPTRAYDASKGEDQYRRGLYTWWQRSFLHPSMVAFDAPSREECAAERNRSNIPQQALVLLNDPTYLDAARALGARIVKDGGSSSDARINWAWKQTLARAPRPDELATVRQLFEKHLAQYKADDKAAEALLKGGAATLPAESKRAELAAWTSVARVLINLHETITRS